MLSQQNSTLSGPTLERSRIEFPDASLGTFRIRKQDKAVHDVYSSSVDLRKQYMGAGVVHGRQRRCL